MRLDQSMLAIWLEEDEAPKGELLLQDDILLVLVRTSEVAEMVLLLLQVAAIENCESLVDEVCFKQTHGG